MGRPSSAQSQFLLLLLVAGAAFALAGKSITPKFKWGQTKDLIFVSVLVRDLDTSSVSVTLKDEMEVSFAAKSLKGEQYALDLKLRDDVKSMKWEIPARADKWGTAVLLTLQKKNEHKWDVLVTDTKKYKGLIDKDWTREDSNLENVDEIAYIEDHKGYIMRLTEKNLNATLSKFDSVFAYMRYPWCQQCKTQDDTFAKVAKSVKTLSKKEPKWKKVAFAVIDAREERRLAREYGANCGPCEFKVFGAPGENPISQTIPYGESEMTTTVTKYLDPPVKVVSSLADVKPLREANTTCFGHFASETTGEFALFKKVARILQGDGTVFVALFGADATGSVEIWLQGDNVPSKYEGLLADNGTELLSWVRPRTVPLLQPYDWQLRQTYENLGLPMGKVWIDDKATEAASDKITRHIVRKVAKQFIGRIAFVELKKSTNSYELRDFGLNQPELYPAFGMTSNASYTALKYALDTSAAGFWSDADKAADSLASFCEKVLGGIWPEAHNTGAPQTNWSTGLVKRIVWKTYHEIESPAKPLLLEVYGGYRADKERKTKESENLAKLLTPYTESFIVASYDTADNYLPAADFQREKYSSDTEWYWVPAKEASAERSPVRKLMKPKKDAPITAVLEFAKKNSGLEMDLDALIAQFNDMMGDSTSTTTLAPGQTEIVDMEGMPSGEL